MCLIIDINVAHKILFNDNDPDFGEVHRRLFVARKNNLKMVYGGYLLQEYGKSESILRQLKILDQAGRARAINDENVTTETERLKKAGTCRSDDPHIVALARCSNARVLCSHDQNLHADFTNVTLVSNPRGKVFQSTQHSHLLRDPCP